MKQFDTVKNNEWVPVEEDLENTIKVVDSLPTASESELGNTYLLNGAMDGYTKTHFYKCLKDETTGLYYWSDLNVGRYSVGNCKSIKVMIIDDGLKLRVLISWRDPDDVIVGSEKIFWQKTVLVHQVGHMPIDINDGTSILTNTVRDKYAVFGSFSFDIDADNRVHYFKLFPVSEDNAITNDDANGRRGGYNYQITADTTPVYVSASDNKTYYEKKLNPSTGLTTYDAMPYNSTYFDGDPSTGWRFKTTIAYYEYQTSYITWSSLRELIQDGQAGTYFPIGSILVLPYHGDFGEMSYEVVDFDGVQLYDSSKKHSMTLQAKYLYRWWDYDGGVVFDTNEKGGTLTQDVSRNNSKVYFKQLKCGNASEKILGRTNSTSNLWFDDMLDLDPAKECKKYDGNGVETLYIETIFDASNHCNPGSVAWSSSDSYECELPYTTNPIGDLMTKKAQGTTNPADQTGTAAGNYVDVRVAPSDLAEGGVRQIMAYAYNSAGTFSMKAPNAQANSDWNIQQPNYASSELGWGPSYWPRSWCGGPRQNWYADRFLRIPKVNGKRQYYTNVKYFCAAESQVSRWRNVTMSGTKATITYNRGTYLYVRDCTRDLHSMITPMLAASTTNSRGYDRYRFDPTATSGATAENTNMEAVGRYLLKVPTGDDVFMSGKKYYKMVYVEKTFLGSTLVSPYLYYYTYDTSKGLYYRAPYETATYIGIPVEIRESTTTDLSTLNWEDVSSTDLAIYGEVYFDKSTSGPSPFGKGYKNATISAAVGENVAQCYYTFNPGDLIPMTSKTPIYALQKGKTYGSTTLGDYIWTKGDQSGGLYTVCAQDFRNCYTADSNYSGYLSGKAGYAGFSNTKPSSTASSTNGNACYGWRTTDIYEGAWTDYGSGTALDGTTITGRTQNNMFYKTPNLERVAYGNHVWAQSNLRMYFNGPMDSSAVYQLTNDKAFADGCAYYRYSSGSGYTLMTKGTDYDVGNGINDGISQSAKSLNVPVYVKYAGGVPVGYKIDPYNPMKYWSYGVSPVQQYKYNGVSNTWTGVFNDGDNWWVGQPSVNNGLVYDRLAAMYWSSCVLTGIANNNTKHFSEITARKGTGYNESHCPQDSTSSSSGSWSGVVDATSTNVSLTAIKMLPRQSFLHGFLDCMYKRSTDTTADASKTYYYRNPYGEYEIQNSSSDVVRDGPFKSCLYEYNSNWLNDISDAKEFLDAIQPVVNHNGCYGTTGAYDFYPQTATGTTTLDKVWLASTVQVAGTPSHSGGGATVNTGCANNGVYENTTPNSFAGETNRATSNYKNHRWALAKYADATDATATDPKYGATSLNGVRIKYGYTIGQHTTSGYGDKLDVAQYWWLRSAGGGMQYAGWDYWGIISSQGRPGPTPSVFIYYAPDRGWDIIPWLSPLITLA